jgi:hypothetical protein
MSLPLYDDGVASGLISGVLFGYVLESAGFASPRKLTAQFRFTDWSVFKVMFTAIIVAGIGLYAATATGLMQANGIYIPTNYFWSMLVGGALVGAGMAIGGYCPGTSAVSFATGRFDSLFFMIGMVLGTGLFAGVFDWIKGFYFAAQGPEAQTLSQLFGVPTWAVLAVLVVVAIVGFALGTWFEQRSGGALTAEELNGGERTVIAEEIDVIGVRLSGKA